MLKMIMFRDGIYYLVEEDKVTRELKPSEVDSVCTLLEEYDQELKDVHSYYDGQLVDLIEEFS